MSEGVSTFSRYEDSNLGRDQAFWKLMKKISKSSAPTRNYDVARDFLLFRTLAGSSQAVLPGEGLSIGDRDCPPHPPKRSSKQEANQSRRRRWRRKTYQRTDGAMAEDDEDRQAGHTRPMPEN